MADNNPYVGPVSFSEEDRGQFFGRDEEARELSYLLIARRAVLLYAQSGAGKTSLLQAKVIPDLRDSGEMRVLPVARVSGPAEGDNVYVANSLAALKVPATTLATALAPLFAETRKQEEEQIPHLLIFDQFEEIFTFRPELADQRRAFFEQLRDCLAAYSKLGLLLSMREDSLADMDSFAGYLPDRLRTRMRMERLSNTQAEEAISRPAANAGKPFDAGIARRLADDLRRVQTARKPAAGASNDGHALGKYVEPVQLQIVCRQFWSKLPDDATTITAQHIDTLARVDDALTIFYRDSLAAVRAKLPTLSERKLREWFVEHLITSAKTRGMVYQGELETEKLPNAAVEVLRERYILRADIRPSGTWYELAHDRLVEPILADNLEWRARYRNPVADALARGPHNLLTGRGLADGRRYREENPQELTPEEQLFLTKSEEEEVNTKRQAKKEAAMYSAVVVLLLGVIGFLIGWLNQDAIMREVRWYRIERPYRVANFDHFVRSLDVDTLKPGEKFRDCNPDLPSACPEMTVVPRSAGPFEMGSDPTEKWHRPEEAPKHKVTIANPFAVATFKITYDNWDVCVSKGACIYSPPVSDAGWGRGRRPVMYVTYEDVQRYIGWLSKMTGKPYRLLSEAEYEYAARAGSKKAYPWGDEPGTMNANCNGCGHPLGGKKTTPVDVFKPNAFGLHDMVGNLWERVEDCYNPAYEVQESTGTRLAPQDGSAWMQGDCLFNVVRGGSWYVGPELIRVSARDRAIKDEKDYNLGFRVARSLVVP
jgi:formylglycine-generating enzyme required for sulfatase activity